jgi:hypothetical protein
MYWDTYDFHGVYDYLWITTGPGNSHWDAYDAWTGDWVYTLEGVPATSGTPNLINDNKRYGPKGEILIYTVNQEDGWMTLWNSTNVIGLYGSIDRTSSGGLFGYGQWRPFGKTVNATGYINSTLYNSQTTPLDRYGYMYNVSIPDNLPGTVYATLDDRIIGADFDALHVTTWAIDISPGHEGTMLWGPKSWTPPASWAAGNQTITFAAVSGKAEDGVFVLDARDQRVHYGFSAETGDYLWVTTPPEIYLNWYGIPRERAPVIGYGKLFGAGIGGTVYAYDITDGSRAWTYNATDPYNEFLFSNNWWLYPLFITDGKIYYGSLEHSPVDPRPRGAPILALDVNTGAAVWRADGLARQTLWGGRAIIGDSIIFTQDTYSQQAMAIGKGPSATTVTAGPKVVSKGSGVMIEGMVTDISPGTEDYGIMARFPDGVPAVADEDMSAWMLYVYKQFNPRPSAAGVTVTIDAYAPDGSYTTIGTVQSDNSGMFKMMWTPDQEGEYTIIATFMGSKSYYASYAQTALGVGPAPSPEAPIEHEVPFITTEIAILIAVVVIAAIAIVGYLVLKRR